LTFLRPASLEPYKEPETCSIYYDVTLEPSLANLTSIELRSSLNSGRGVGSFFFAYLMLSPFPLYNTTVVTDLPVSMSRKKPVPRSFSFLPFKPLVLQVN